MEQPPQKPAAAPESEDEIGIWDARLLHIYISKGHDYWGRQGEGRLQSGIEEVSSVECVAGSGLRGDRYFDYKPNFKGQVTFLDHKVVEEIRSVFKLPRLPASVFRRNLVVEGIELKKWLGRRFKFQGLIFEGSQECKPCEWMDRVVARGAEEFLKRGFRGGLRAKVISSGFLTTTRSDV